MSIMVCVAYVAILSSEFGHYLFGVSVGNADEAFPGRPLKDFDSSSPLPSFPISLKSNFQAFGSKHLTFVCHSIKSLSSSIR